MPTTPHPNASQDQWLPGSDERHGDHPGRATTPPIIETPCAPHPVAAPALPRRRARQGGFTLIEMLIATAVAGTLSSIAYPSFQGQIQKTRRAEALVAMMTLQLAEERWRSNSAAYGSLAQVGAPATTASGHYTLQVSAITADGYQALATAAGNQASDSTCRFMKLTVDGAMVSLQSGPTLDTVNTAAVNRQCWNQ